MTESVDSRPIAFIACPIGNKFAPRGSVERRWYDDNVRMWEDVFEAACEELDLRAVRADKISESGEITEQIFTFLRDADVVIADVSGANPNVMYELGLRHTLDRPTVIVGEYDRLPFDVNTIRTIQFRRTEGGLIDLRDSLIAALRSALAGGGLPVSATRIWAEGAVAPVAVIEQAVEVSAAEDDNEEDDEPGTLELLAEGERAVYGVSEVLTDASTTIQEIGEHTAVATEAIKASDAANKGFAGRLLIAKELATTLAEPADDFAVSVAGFIDHVQAMDVMVRYVAGRGADSESDRADLQGFFASVISLVDAAEEASVNISNYGRSAANLRKFSSVLKSVSRSLEGSANTYLEGIAVISGWRALVEPLLDPESDPSDSA
ncbi:hypothetical protein [Microbacterium sp. IO18]|uniref:hypothetical protein n=1 Tax=Microbacterium sp. IO18 TaxID=3390997 RepID=UPI003BA1A83E